MAKAAWGLKHRCRSCGAPFYDLKRVPVICPICASPCQSRDGAKSQPRVPAVKAVARPPPKPEPAASEDKPGGKQKQPDEVKQEEKAAGGGDFIEDASELGEDEDDMAEVLEGANPGQGVES